MEAASCTRSLPRAGPRDPGVEFEGIDDLVTRDSTSHRLTLRPGGQRTPENEEHAFELLRNQCWADAQLSEAPSYMGCMVLLTLHLQSCHMPPGMSDKKPKKTIRRGAVDIAAWEQSQHYLPTLPRLSMRCASSWSSSIPSGIPAVEVWPAHDTPKGGCHASGTTIFLRRPSVESAGEIPCPGGRNPAHEVSNGVASGVSHLWHRISGVALGGAKQQSGI